MTETVLAGLERVLPQITLKMKYEQAVRKLEQLGPELEDGLRGLGRIKRDYEKLEREPQGDVAAYRRKISRKISQGTRRGLVRARARGVKLGGARPRASKINLNELRRLSRRGLTQQQIAAKLGCSQALVSRRLKEKEEETRRKIGA